MLSFDELTPDKPPACQQDIIKGLDSPTLPPLLEGFDLILFPDTPSIWPNDENIENLDKELLSATTLNSEWPLLDGVISSLQLGNPQGPNDILVNAASQSTTIEELNHSIIEETSPECDSEPLTSSTGSPLENEPDTDRHLPIRLRVSQQNTVSVASLRKRLSNATDKYSHSTLEDIVSIMEHCTISTSSSASVAPSRLSMGSSTYLPMAKNDAQLLHKFEYPVVLPGAFPEFCWEQIINNRLMRCERGQKYRKAKICRHTGRRPNQLMNYCPVQYKAYAGPGGEKVDIFGNSALHVAAALATSPDTLISLVRSNVSIHTLNNAGQTFLHLIHPDCHNFHGVGSDICSLLKELHVRGFNFSTKTTTGGVVFIGLRGLRFLHLRFLRLAERYLIIEFQCPCRVIISVTLLATLSQNR